jgi:DNA-binding XRE family transcriptional regulator
MRYMCMLAPFRKYKKMSQWELAQELKVDRTVISEIETGKRLPDITLRERIAALVDRRPQEIWP